MDKKNQFNKIARYLMRSTSMLSIGIAAAVLITAGAGYLAWLDNKQVKESIIQDAQTQILETAKAKAQILEAFFNEHSTTLESLAEDPNIQKKTKNKIPWKKDSEEFCPLTNIFDKHKGIFSSAYLLDNAGVILDREPFKEGRIGGSYASRLGVAYVLNKHESYVSDVFQAQSGDNSVSIIEPIFYDTEFVGMLRFVVDLKLFNNEFFKQTRSEKGSKVWLLDSNGVLVAHPQFHHVAENPLVTAKKEFKPQELASYANLIENMNAGRKGVGVYQTACLADESHKIIKKYIGFAPIQLGNKTWSVAVCRDYDEILKPVNRHTRTMAGIGGLLALLFGAGGIYSYRKRKREAVLEAEADNLKKIANGGKALRESEEKYRTILENMEEGYYEVDLAGNFTFANDAMCRIRGMSRDELIGTNNREHMTPETAKEVYEAFNKVYTTGEPVRNLEYGISGQDGEILYVETSASLIKASGGEPTGFRGVVRDVTERRRDREERREMKAQLQQAQKMEAVGTLAGGIAHDFNNVLYSIIGYTELTMDDVPEGSLAQKNLKEVLNGALRARDMILQILAFSRKADTVKKPIKVQSVVAEALKFLRTSIPTTIEIRQNIDDDYGPILADSTQLHQVIMNLATNAYQAMREKGGVLELTLMEEQIGPDDSGPDLNAGTYLKLTVSDTGHGMDKTVMEKIFDPYFTTRGPGEGTGMGLAVVHGIVKDHGGDIKVYSELGEGTTFSVYLPLIETIPVEQKTIAAGPAPTGTEHILFVDDEEYLVFMTQQILERLGYQVTSRTSSVEALEAFRAKPDEYDLVITDMTMPNMTGVELSTRLKEIKPDIPIILCTGFSEMIDEDKARSMGISAYIMKPILKDEIGGAIRKVLDEVS